MNDDRWYLTLWICIDTRTKYVHVVINNIKVYLSVTIILAHGINHVTVYIIDFAELNKYYYDILSIYN